MSLLSIGPCAFSFLTRSRALGMMRFKNESAPEEEDKLPFADMEPRYVHYTNFACANI